MKYKKRKFCFRKKELLGSKLFAISFKNKDDISFLNDYQSSSEGNDTEWRKRLKIKENILALHFKEVLQNYKPKILI